MSFKIRHGKVVRDAPEILTREQLDQMGCGNPDCPHGGDHPVIWYGSPPCHPQAGLGVFYDKRKGTITLVCFECERPFREILVAADKPVLQ